MRKQEKKKGIIIISWALIWADTAGGHCPSLVTAQAVPLGSFWGCFPYVQGRRAIRLLYQKRVPRNPTLVRRPLGWAPRTRQNRSGTHLDPSVRIQPRTAQWSAFHPQ